MGPRARSSSTGGSVTEPVFKDLHEVRQAIKIGGMVADALCDVMGRLFEVLGTGDGFDDNTVYLRNRAYVVEYWLVEVTEVPR